jgi:hypothetical protein
MYDVAMKARISHLIEARESMKADGSRGRRLHNRCLSSLSSGHSAQTNRYSSGGLFNCSYQAIRLL